MKTKKSDKKAAAAKTPTKTQQKVTKSTPPRTAILQKDENSIIPLEHGFYKKICQRKSGKTAFRFDIYIYDPQNRKIRSKKHLIEHLAAEYPEIPGEAIISAWEVPSYMLEERDAQKALEVSLKKKTPTKTTPKKISTEPKTPKEIVPIKKRLVKEIGEPVNNQPEKKSIPTPPPQQPTPQPKTQLSLKDLFKKQIMDYSLQSNPPSTVSPDTSDTEMSSEKENNESTTTPGTKKTLAKKKPKNESSTKLETQDNYLLYSILAQDWHKRFISEDSYIPPPNVPLNREEHPLPVKEEQETGLEYKLIELGIGMDTSFEYTSNDELIV